MAGLDRIQALADGCGTKPPRIPGFKVRGDHFIRPQTPISTYRRVQILENLKTRTTIYFQYHSVCPWLAPFKITVIAGEHHYLTHSGLRAILGAFRTKRLSTVELAIDFSKNSKVDRAFALRHCICGKSRLVGGRLYGELRFGTRNSETMVRAYEKSEIPSFRLEIELHSAWLRKNRLQDVADLAKLSVLLMPRRIQFASIDWEQVACRLSTKGLRPETLIEEAQENAHSIHNALRYLRDEFELDNVHRFLRPLRLNRTVREALHTWANHWRGESELGITK